MKFTSFTNKIIVGLLSVGLFSCGTSKEVLEPEIHNPSKPIEISSFYPVNGGLATRVIINGSNFGSDISKIRVKYNKKNAN